MVCADFASGRTRARREVPAEARAAAIEAFLAGGATAARRSRAPLVLVCTDGRHDRCCGKLGRSLVAALRGLGRRGGGESPRRAPARAELPGAAVGPAVRAGRRPRDVPGTARGAATRPRVPALLPRSERALGARAGGRSRGARGGSARGSGADSDATRVSVAVASGRYRSTLRAAELTRHRLLRRRRARAARPLGGDFRPGRTPLRCRITACGSGSCWRRPWPSCLPRSARARPPSS